MNTTTGVDVSWRQLQPHLWVGRVDGRPIGEIEQGRRFTFIEPCGTVHRGYPSLAAAQQAAVCTCGSADPPDDAGD